MKSRRFACRRWTRRVLKVVGVVGVARLAVEAAHGERREALFDKAPSFGLGPSGSPVLRRSWASFEGTCVEFW